MKIGDLAYVSYWPGGGGAEAKKDFKIKQTHEGAWISRLSVDTRLERRSPDVSVDVNGLDEAAMQVAFEEFKAKAPLYNMRKHNCATVIAYLLEIGSGKKPTFVPMMNVADALPPGLLRTIVKIGTLGGAVEMWTPQAIRDYAQELTHPTGKA
jgi:hypothetical protein